MSSSLAPTTTRLCASCATVEASAPRCSPEPERNAEADPARGEVPLDDRDLDEVAPGVGDRVAVDDERLARRGTRSRPGPSTRPIARAAPPSTGSRSRPRSTGLMRTVWRTHSGTSARGTSSIGRPRLSTSSGTKRLEVGRARGDRRRSPGATAPWRSEPVPLRRVEGRHHDRVGRLDAGGDRVAHHAVDVAVVGDVLGVAVVGAEGDPTRAVLGDERQQRLQVARHRRLADQEPHARRAAARGPPRP